MTFLTLEYSLFLLWRVSGIFLVSKNWPSKWLLLGKNWLFLPKTIWSPWQTLPNFRLKVTWTRVLEYKSGCKETHLLAKVLLLLLIMDLNIYICGIIAQVDICGSVVCLLIFRTKIWHIKGLVKILTTAEYCLWKSFEICKMALASHEL